MKAAIIGTGSIARVHARALRRVAGVEIGAVCDLSPGLARCFAEQFGGVRWFGDHSELLAQGKPDCVFVTTPILSHVPIAVDCLKAGAHVLVEKPIALGLDQWRTLRQAAEEAGRILVEDQNYRFNGPVVHLREAIWRGQLGDIVHMDLVYCLPIHGKGSPFADRSLPNPLLKMPGGAILDFLPHMAYLVHELVGRHDTVKTLWMKRDSETILPHDEFRAMLKCERGTACIAFSSHAQPPACHLRVFGTRMTFRCNLFEGSFVQERSAAKPGPLLYLRNGWRDSLGTALGACRSLMRKLADDPASYAGLREFDRRFCVACAGKGTPPVSLDEIEGSVSLVDALTREMQVA